MSSDSIRRKIETLGTQISLPTVRKALGVLEGEHASGRRSGAGDVMDVRAYEPGDESRLIDWKTSARQGQPMVVERERLSTSRVWLLMDVGREMQGICPSGEHAYEVAANALRMFAALSLRRSDDVSIVLGDESSITRIPFNGGFAQFERTLDKSLEREWNHQRNIDALLEYARRIKDTHALIVLATDELALAERHIAEFRRIARTHPVVLIDVATLNPFKPLARGHAAPLDGLTNRRVPAFLRSAASAQQVETHRQYLAAALEQELNRTGSFMIRAGSSESMFNQFVSLVSVALARTTRNQLGAAPALSLAGER
ncbi:DUF58 domain-containing protein [Bifidobacterium sp. LC6]|uniref:DUF58 domain-containing protein n=1 Tax=Bifidobacterium colobi TaxID=2809026 RepID=A0ABS5UVY5_9BIFI|nr:DUF58 domain-containing protein [Bifidobacterium colobi]